MASADVQAKLRRIAKSDEFYRSLHRRVNKRHSREVNRYLNDDP